MGKLAPLITKARNIPAVNCACLSWRIAFVLVCRLCASSEINVTRTQAAMCRWLNLRLWHFFFFCRDLMINKMLASSIDAMFTIYQSACLHLNLKAASSTLSEQQCPLVESFGNKCTLQTSMWAAALRMETVAHVNVRHSNLIYMTIFKGLARWCGG